MVGKENLLTYNADKMKGFDGKLCKKMMNDRLNNVKQGIAKEALNFRPEFEGTAKSKDAHPGRNVTKSQSVENFANLTPTGRVTQSPVDSHALVDSSPTRRRGPQPQDDSVSFLNSEVSQSHSNSIPLVNRTSSTSPLRTLNLNTQTQADAD